MTITHTRTKTMTAAISRKGRAGELLAWTIAGLAWAISFASQVGLALAHGFHGWDQWEAVAMALISDLGATAMMLISLDQAERGRSSRLTWLISAAAAGMMEWANVAFAWGDQVSVILHAWPPLLAVATLFVLVHVRRTNHEDVAILPAPAEEPGPPEVIAPDPYPDQSGAITRTRQDQVRALLVEDPEITGEEAGRRLGIDAAQARRHLRRARGGPGESGQIPDELTVVRGSG